MARVPADRRARLIGKWAFGRKGSRQEGPTGRSETERLIASHQVEFRSRTMASALWRA